MAENWKNCLEEELICPICLNVFSEPVQLPCKHNFCRMCINEAWSKETGMVRCPECNHAYSQKPALEKNHKLSNIVEKFNALNVEKMPAVLHCILCRRGPPLQAQKVCLRCNAPCCHSHVQTHLQQPSSNAGHLLVDAEDVRAWSCPQHDEYRLYHCETEHVAVCQYCCFSRCATNHGHAVCDIEVRRNDIRVSGLNCLCYALHSVVLPPAKGHGSLLDVAETMTISIDVVASIFCPLPPFFFFHLNDKQLGRAANNTEALLWAYLPSTGASLRGVLWRGRTATGEFNEESYFLWHRWGKRPELDLIYP